MVGSISANFRGILVIWPISTFLGRFSDLGRFAACLKKIWAQPCALLITADSLADLHHNNVTDSPKYKHDGDECDEIIREGVKKTCIFGKKS